MVIDFHDRHNRGAYATRSADDGWAQAVGRFVDLQGCRIADIGCGGGIYSTAMAQRGAAYVIGVDFSAQMVEDARRRADALGVVGVEFRQGTAERTGLPAGSVDLVLQRALVHHLDSLEDAFVEARRILGGEGVLLVQDRTMDDVLVPPSPEHLRGWFFERFPRLIEVEARRRPDAVQIEAALRDSGFREVSRHPLSELRRTYRGTEELRAELMARTGRSILHELDDHELAELTDRICHEADAAHATGTPIREVDHWTVWEARVDPLDRPDHRRHRAADHHRRAVPSRRPCAIRPGAGRKNWGR